MANENPVFAYVEARIAAWQAVLASLKSALALDPGGQAVEGIDLSSVAASQNGEIGQPIDLPEGAFLGKSVPVCVKLYLSAAKRKKTIKEIAAALREGGVESTSANFENVVTGALFRLKRAGEVLRFKEGWGLPQWYPAHIRAAAPTGPRKLTKKKRKKARTKESAAAPPAHKSESLKVTEIVKPAEGKPESRIMNFLKTNHGPASASDVAHALDLKIQTVHLVLAKLAHQTKVQRLPSGHFKALGAAAVG